MNRENRDVAHNAPVPRTRINGVFVGAGSLLISAALYIVLDAIGVTFTKAFQASGLTWVGFVMLAVGIIGAIQDHGR